MGALGSASVLYGFFAVSTSDLMKRTIFGLQSWQLMISGGYALFFCANLIPGRLDTVLGRPKRTDLRFFTPAGFAFAIWAPIFLGEMLMMFSVLMPDSLRSPGSGWLEAMAPSYAAASVAQALWCLAFRPWALKYQWIPASLLTIAALALFESHRHVASSYSMSGAASLWSLFACRIPVALHFGWITAAAALSWNGQLASMGSSIPIRITSATLSCYAAAAFLGVTSIVRGDGWPAATAAWALYAVSKGHEVLRGAVDNAAIDALNLAALLSSSASLAMAVFTWAIPFFSSGKTCACACV
ncbi:hypothetical protein GUITHDRAFT_100057 [Guillardia theta CCMP2712]|uniref:Uncharacterized protein n=1 Tax=Guillardia theta (strain CCMP2712) TaxID=905079 RepID=L1K151_GUITC|nr:hypothetical protein GUITHDRAFT_100057 [Guillardia theta CCMP2712]EKX54581.1 hypothetical protein GUITHDRAFT_100057 [Guillardia theta CCMP2712]|eukprot:XP_005841561.1 hypothetical protein GUITHDRAFT_100057 [Guillardia theta CCMP2712]